MTFLSPYPPGCTTADIDCHYYGSDAEAAYPDCSEQVRCPSCNWSGSESEATWLCPDGADQKIPDNWNAYCPDCGERLW